jgi:hypothetical protein
MQPVSEEGRPLYRCGDELERAQGVGIRFSGATYDALAVFRVRANLATLGCTSLSKSP